MLSKRRLPLRALQVGVSLVWVLAGAQVQAQQSITVAAYPAVDEIVRSAIPGRLAILVCVPSNVSSE